MWLNTWPLTLWDDVAINKANIIMATGWNHQLEESFFAVYLVDWVMSAPVYSSRYFKVFPSSI